MAGKESYYYARAGALNRELKQRIPSETLKKLHRKQPWRHFAVALRQILLLLSMPVVIYFFQDQPLIWVPAAIIQGFTVFSFSVLLHEAVHKCIFNHDRYNLNDKLGLLYGSISGLAASQFTRWHMDHHYQLGDAGADPKRAHLTPKTNARWLKLLYFTPALYPIYFRAAFKAQNGYEPELRARIKKERLFAIGLHLAVLIFYGWLSPLFLIKAGIIPLFFVFPVAFAVNRVAQHYVIDPDDIAHWSTRMQPNTLWNTLFLWSSYHLEHHYYPAVPFYNLKALNLELQEFYRQRSIPAYGYVTLLKMWLFDNHLPHSKPTKGTVAAAKPSRA
ncbi:fatty acid desaturase family protein [Acanthopleuribacter pedis]|uniref:Fatty acid desaturase n=1 Tax=Acanthopleuribacter pedis TaxID=442870 RepID=A0A8J7Q3A9_9BACT|nr:fatty acid desaturase [Acanthopleuribacter pedis]MBO1319762.1 fatty acid desaturase [Acanthopleuribacter pedis]